MSSILIYSKPGCAFCDKAKALLQMKKIDFTESVLGQDILSEDFQSLFPEVRAVPFIIIDGVKIGGYDKLVEWVDRRPEYLAG